MHVDRSARRRARRLTSLATAAAALLSASATSVMAQPPQGDSAAVAAVVGRFHDALAAGDSAGALALLAPDVVILESGGAETRDQYRSHHLPADIAFARAVRSERSPVRVSVRGDVAWAHGTSATKGEYRGRPIDSAGAELVVLVRTAEGWRISALHWSSRNRRPAGG
jgi:ketosteroid isomerase-like protein